MPVDRLTSLTQWAALQAHAEVVKGLHMRHQFDAEPNRFIEYSLGFDGLLLDYSKNRVTSQTIPMLMELAEACQLEAARRAMFDGQLINISESRAALHVALRDLSDRAYVVNGKDVTHEIKSTRKRVYEFAENIRNGTLKGFSGDNINAVVHIGIGGSDLGPRFLTDAFAGTLNNGPRVHFAADGAQTELKSILVELEPQKTLFIIASKSFTTAETMANAELAKKWISNAEGSEAVASHFVAITMNGEAAANFGISTDSILPIWDWVGGRYSVWSAIGLPIACAHGQEAFEQLLAGAHAMDKHFESAPFSNNLPAIMGMLGVWYVNFFEASATAILPYDSRLSGFTSYLQQLEMESNGKIASHDGQVVSVKTAPVLFGGSGNAGQHSFFQLLHQGSNYIPCDFIVSAEGACERHDEIVANCFAQSEALMRGCSQNDLTSIEINLLPHLECTGNRPSNTILLDEVSPFTLGMLLALYEHKVFVQSVIWNINPFDQWGVELGKKLVSGIMVDITSGQIGGEHDGSTQGLMAAYCQARKS